MCITKAMKKVTVKNFAYWIATAWDELKQELHQNHRGNIFGFENTNENNENSITRQLVLANEFLLTRS